MSSHQDQRPPLASRVERERRVRKLLPRTHTERRSIAAGSLQRTCSAAWSFSRAWLRLAAVFNRRKTAPHILSARKWHEHYNPKRALSLENNKCSINRFPQQTIRSGSIHANPGSAAVRFTDGDFQEAFHTIVRLTKLAAVPVPMPSVFGKTMHCNRLPFSENLDFNHVRFRFQHGDSVGSGASGVVTKEQPGQRYLPSAFSFDREGFAFVRIASGDSRN